MRQLISIFIILCFGMVHAAEHQVHVSEDEQKRAWSLLQEGHKLKRDGDLAGAIDKYELSLVADPGLNAATSSLEGAQAKLAIANWAKAALPAECRQTDETAEIELLLGCATDHFSIYGQPIHPSIIEALQGWISDGGHQIVSVNVIDAQESNWVCCEDITFVESSGFFLVNEDEGGFFVYKRIGVTESGLHLLHTVQNTGGSGQFNSIMIVSVSLDKGLQQVEGAEDVMVVQPLNDRLLVKNLGYISLGDRWDGRLSVEGDVLVVGQDEGWFSGREGYEDKGYRIRIEYP
ncbi:MAG: hypothetical protein GY746_04075 [Gammaproteobacteria bacterium]|nr:hypothetical protein [Gammaproteobacteria bacterium]MCP4831965.1 hypothetical protein [Gammaproteobacteria bacterium]